MDKIIKKTVGFTAIGLCLVMMGLSIQANAQYKGILWAVPTDASVLPVGNTIMTANAELNSIFEEYHVEAYSFLDSVFLECTCEKEAVYEIRMKKEYAYLERDLRYRLNRYPFYANPYGLFKEVCQPYYGYF